MDKSYVSPERMEKKELKRQKAEDRFYERLDSGPSRRRSSFKLPRSGRKYKLQF